MRPARKGRDPARWPAPARAGRSARCARASPMVLRSPTRWASLASGSLREACARCASADSRVGLLAAAAILLAAFAAHAGVNVAPTRLVLEHGSREGEFVVVNPGTTTERYRVTLVNRCMGDDGRIVDAPSALPGDSFEDALIHFMPRLLVLRPNEPETVRVRIEPRGELIWGEYRSHLMLEQIPQPPAAPAPDAPR